MNETGADVAEQIYRAVAAALGLRVRRTHAERRFTFTGRTIQLGYNLNTEPYRSDLAHELGHAIAASRGRKKIAEYGFGYSYELLSDRPSRIRTKAADAEEALASLLGILLQRRVEGRPAALATWHLHNWPNAGPPGEPAWRYALSKLRTPRGRSKLKELLRLLRRHGR